MFYALGKVIELALIVYLLLVFARVVISWVDPDRHNEFVRFVNNVTEPLLLRIRKAIPVVWAGFDFSPVIVIFVIYFLIHLINRILM